MISDDALNALKDRNPVHAVASEYVRLRKKGRSYIGPCPICSDDPQSKTAPRFECNADKWVCAVCRGGGDVIKLVSQREGIGFREAVDRLGGARKETPTPRLACKAGRRAFEAGAGQGDVPAAYAADDALYAAWRDGWADGQRREQFEMKARERERARLYYEFWKPAERWPGTPVEAYLSGRRVMVPTNARLRYHPSIPMFADGRESEPVLLHRGPAMLAPFLDAGGIFRGLHITWLDASGPNGKASIVNPETGEVMPTKKMRGTKRGCYIDLGGAKDPRRVISGEGNETVAAVYTALVRAGRDLSSTALRVAGDLGNLAGKASATVAHPTLKDRGNRPRRVPGPDPDLSSPAMPVPESAVELVLLGDGDSEPFLTRNALECSSRRHARPGRIIRVRFAPDGLDFNDVIQGKMND
jgi:CHC2 zinc finger